MKRAAFILSIMVCLVMFAVPVSAAGGNYVKSYTVNVKIDADRTYDVTEVIDYYFASASKGFYRNMLVQGEMDDVLSTGQRTSALVPYTCSFSDVMVEEYPFKTSTYAQDSETFYKIDVGDPDKPFTGLNRLTIHYKIAVGGDSDSAFDKLAYYLIGTWDCSIRKANFTIEMPGKFDKDKLNVTRFGSGKLAYLPYKVSGNTITASVANLAAGENVFLSAALPKGYLNGIAALSSGKPAEPTASPEEPASSPDVPVTQNKYVKNVAAASTGLATVYGVAAVAGIVLAIVLPLHYRKKRRQKALAALAEAQRVDDSPAYEVTCPNCGASNNVHAGHEAQCEYCKSALPVQQNDIHIRFF